MASYFYLGVCSALYTFILLGLMVSQSSGREVRAYEEISQTLRTVFRKYDDELAPQIDYLQPIAVSVGVTLDHVYSFDVANQTLHSLISLNVSWSDRRLAWYPINIGNFLINRLAIWKPHLSFLNGISLAEPVTEPIINLEHNGNLYWYRRLSVKTLCHTDRDDEIHSCPYLLRSSPYKNTEERLRVTRFLLSDTFSNHHWDVNVNSNLTGVQDDDDDEPAKIVVDLRPKTNQSPDYLQQQQEEEGSKDMVDGASTTPRISGTVLFLISMSVSILYNSSYF